MMDSEVRFSGFFKKRMLTLALITGIFIVVCTPLTYLMLSMLNERNEAYIHSKEIASKLMEAVKENPDFWQYNIPKFSKAFYDYNQSSEGQNSQVSNVKVYGSDHTLVYEEIITAPFIFDVQGHYNIFYNNRDYGYVVVEEKTIDEVHIGLLLFFIFGCLGVAIGLVLYKFPTRIVTLAQQKTNESLQKLQVLSYYDPLTNLPNRHNFTTSLSKAIELARQRETKFAVIFLDLDRFKIVNDTLGHNNGDTLLQIIGKRLKNCVKQNDLVARMGGDEFVILLQGVNENQQIIDVAERIIESLNRPVNILGYEFYLTVSIGISIYPSDGDNLDALVKNADSAMYRAKEQGRNKYEFYTPAFHQSTTYKLKIESSLRRALKEKTGLFLLYQPIVSLITHKIIGVEALLRLESSELGIVMPAQLIPVAEETGLIVPIGEWVLQTACTQCQAWHKEGFDSLQLSVNLSPWEFQNVQLIDTVANVLSKTGLDPQYLQLEITESIAMHNGEHALPRLNALRKQGIKIAIDDFGMGYSSLSRIKDFPIDTLKVDRNFIWNLPRDYYNSVIVNFIIAMARSLELNVIAEGVETREQLDFLIENKCDAMQGYYFYKPLSAGEFRMLLVRDEILESGRLPTNQLA
ncbi:MAG: putative bifunctional diguanylate cyclase/phosphodiesterase [Bacillota bacterium]